ncbi:hypothetical protein KAR91_26095 [Candidatus Pacearchaeota archaeon]|nr:hypothetical protein [Candidatus Pacearchaeota archaeon]
MSTLTNSKTTLSLPAGQALTIASPSGSSGLAVLLPRLPGGGANQSVTQIAGSNLIFGPYAQPERFEITCTTGTLTLTIATATPVVLATSIDNGDTTHAPDGNSVFDALALKGDLASMAPEILAINEKTPVNAVAASGILTLSANADHLDTVTIGGNVYTFHVALSAASKAAAILTLTGLPVLNEVVVINTDTYRWRDQIAAVAASKVLTVTGAIANNETVVLDTETYTFKTALTEAKADSTLTLTANFSDGNSITINDRTYRFKETIGQINDVDIGVSADATIDNLVAAITNGAGEGTAYYTGTVINADVTATNAGGDTMTIEAKAVGVAHNSYVTTELSDVASWTAGTMANGVDAIANEVKVVGTAELSIDSLILACNGGAGEGADYSTGSTDISATITATKTAADEFTATATVANDAGNAIAIAEAGGNASWAGAAVFLSGGISLASANDVIIGGSAELSIDNLVLAITYDAGAGTNEGVKYGTGTVAHTTVTGAKTAADDFTATALVAGHAANAYASTTDMGNASWDTATLLGGESAQTANDILIGAAADDTINNLVSAVMATAGEGTTYGTGTVVHPDMTAVNTGGDVFTATAKVKGVAGNALAKAEDNTNMDWDGVTAFMTGGIDGTVGVEFELCADSSYLYYAIAENTIADANWRRVDIGAVY